MPREKARRTTSNPLRKSVPARANGGWWADPAKKAAMADKLAEGRSKGGKARAGLPFGWNREDWDCRRQYQRNRAEKIVAHMEANNMLPEPDGITAEEKEMGRTALKEAFAIAIEKEVPHKERLTALKHVMDFTRTKPVVKSETKIDVAEDWLAGIADAAGI